MELAQQSSERICKVRDCTVLSKNIKALVCYAERAGLLEPSDEAWAVNRLLEVLQVDT